MCQNLRRILFPELEHVRKMSKLTILLHEVLKEYINKKLNLLGSVKLEYTWEYVERKEYKDIAGCKCHLCDPC